MDTGAKAVSWRQDSVSTKEAGTTRHSHVKIMNLDTDPTPFTKVNSEWSRDLKLNHQTAKPLEDGVNAGDNLDGLRFSDDFQDTAQRDPWNLEWMSRSSLLCEGHCHRTKRQATEWE